MSDNVRLHRKEALGMDKIVEEYIRQMKLASGLNTQRVYAAWDSCSGAGAYTLRRYFRGGRLTVNLSSSIFREQLSLQKPLILAKMNAFLAQDELFTKDDETGDFIKELVLR